MALEKVGGSKRQFVRAFGLRDYFQTMIEEFLGKKMTRRELGSDDA